MNSRVRGNSSSHHPNARENTPSFPKTLHHSQKHSVIPAKAGIHNSRARGNSTSHYPNAREKHSIIPKNTPSFPKTLRHSQKHSVIPAKAGIHNSRACGNSATLKHHCRGFTPQFPRMREFNVPLLQCPRKTLHHSQKHSVIPAKAGIHNSRACGNSTSHYSNAREKHSIIPACAGMM